MKIVKRIIILLLLINFSSVAQDSAEGERATQEMLEEAIANFKKELSKSGYSKKLVVSSVDINTKTLQSEVAKIYLFKILKHYPNINTNPNSTFINSIKEQLLNKTLELESKYGIYFKYTIDEDTKKRARPFTVLFGKANELILPQVTNNVINVGVSMLQGNQITNKITFTTSFGSDLLSKYNLVNPNPKIFTLNTQGIQNCYLGYLNQITSVASKILYFLQISC